MLGLKKAPTQTEAPTQDAPSKGWANIPVINALAAMGVKVNPAQIPYVDYRQAVAEEAAEVLGYTYSANDLKLATFLHDNGIPVLSAKAVWEYKWAVRKFNDYKGDWEMTDIATYSDIIPTEILKFCISIGRKLKEAAMDEVSMMVDYHDRSPDPFICLISKQDRAHKFYIAVWDEPGFDSQKHWIPVLQDIKER